MSKSHGSSITQDSVKRTGSPGKTYKSGSNVHKGAGGKQSEAAPAAGPKKGK